MKNRVYIALVFALFCCSAQYHAQTASGINCEANSFFAINSSGQIDRFHLTGSIISFDSTCLLSPGLTSIGISDELNGGGFTPTFYGSTYSNPAPISWDGVSWITNSPTATTSIINNGGFGNYQYFTGVWGFSNMDVLRYTGSSYTVIYQSPITRNITSADLAVDNVGNVYVLTGFNTMSDSLLVISPSGQIIKRVAFTLDCTHAYGSFIMNGIYYIGMGSTNPVYPSSLLPIYITANSAVKGSPISFPNSDYDDLASCDPGIMTNTSFDFDYNSINAVVYGGSGGEISCSYNLLHEGQLEIFNAFGQVVWTGDLPSGERKESIWLGLADGLYTWRVSSGDLMVADGKFVIVR